MSENDFHARMEKLQKPTVNPEAAERQFKLMLMSTRKSAIWGIWLILIPVLFLLANIIKEEFKWNWGITDRFIQFMARLDHQPWTGWLTPVLFVLLPCVAVLINILAITHFAYNKSNRELAITVKLSWKNIILIAITVLIVGVVLLYAISENAAHRAIERYD